MNAPSAHNRHGHKVAGYPGEMAGMARERAALYALLATLFRHSPNRQILLTLRSADMREALNLTGMALSEPTVRLGALQLGAADNIHVISTMNTEIILGERIMFPLL